MVTNQLKVFQMSFWNSFWKKWRVQVVKVINPLVPELFCQKFDLLEIVSFSCTFLQMQYGNCFKPTPFLTWVNVCHNHWVGHSHFGTEATKVLRPWLFRAILHAGLLTDTKTWWWPGEYTTLLDLIECQNVISGQEDSKKWRGSIFRHVLIRG